MKPEEFEQAFNSRTLAYHPDFRPDPRAVLVAIGDASHTPAGHALICALINQLARAHRRLIIVGDLNRPLLARDPLGAATLHGATVDRARAINPFIEINHQQHPPPEDVLISLGIDCPAEIRIGATGWCAQFGSDASVAADTDSILGASLAATLAAAAAFHRQIGTDFKLAPSYSLWENAAASNFKGPTFSGPVDVGRVLQAGAGAVGFALDYWLAVLGIADQWTIVDGDDVDATNLNRQMLFLATDAGFPTGQPCNKAIAAAAALGPNAHSIPTWLDQANLADEQFDLILPLANERGARAIAQSRPVTVLLHATTTPNWTAIAHRHIAGHDDCIACRLPEEDPVFTCSTGTIGTTQRTDASLPFLSAAAGVLLLAQIIKLQTGHLLDRATNHEALDLSGERPLATAYRWKCNEGCRVRPPASARLTRPTRWASLEPFNKKP